MFVKAILSSLFVLLSIFIYITPSLAARDENGLLIPLPPCGDFCYTLHSGKSSCSTWEGKLAPSRKECYCNDDDFLHNFIDCVVNSDYCSNIQDVNRSLNYIIDDCEGTGRLMPWGFEELKRWFTVEDKAMKTSVVMPVKPTTYTWTFSAINSFLEVIPTLGPCGPETTSSVEKKSKRDEIGDASSIATITSTTTVHVTITNTITVTIPNSTTQLQIGQPTDIILDKDLEQSSGGVNQKVIKTMESMPIIGSSLSLCPINITITHTKPLLTTIYSTMDYTIITEDTRSVRPTTLYTFWDSTFTTKPTETVTNNSTITNKGSRLLGERNVFFAFVGMMFSIIFLSVF